MRAEPSPVPARFLIHQEGVLGLVAIIGLSFREGGPLPGLLASTSIINSVAAGVVVGLGFTFALWVLRSLPPIRALEAWQKVLVKDWTVSDAVSVAVISGVAEEALLRALLQPLIGLIPAAVLFAVLHLIPDRRLWFWPVMALLIGIVFGLVFEHYGYPAVAIAHALLNGFSLHRLRQPQRA